MERQMTIGLVLTLVTAALIMVFAFRQPQVQEEQAGKQLAMEMNEGAHVFVANQCYSCHGQQGQGLAAPRLNGNDALTRELIVQVVTLGQTTTTYPQNMPAFGQIAGGSLSSHEIEAVATFILYWDQGRIEKELAKKNAGAE